MILLKFLMFDRSERGIHLSPSVLLRENKIISKKVAAAHLPMSAGNQSQLIKVIAEKSKPFRLSQISC